jgi:hypothetical protein
MHIMNKPSRQPELPLDNQATLEALPEEVVAQCRQLIGQMLLQVLQSEKEERRDQP